MRCFFILLSIFSTSFANSQKYHLVDGKPPISITTETEQIGATWSEGKLYDQELIQKFYHLLEKHDAPFVALDIGAQTGCFSLLAKFFPNSKWYAFEPIDEASRELANNLLLNGVKNVEVVKVAVSDYSGFGELKLPKDTHWGLATLGEKQVRFHKFETREVPLITLDEFFKSKNIHQLDFIKIDTEGWELHVLRGGKDLIKKYKPLIVMECNDQNFEQTKTNKADLLTFLEDLGYRWEFISKEDLLCTPLQRE